MPADNKQKRGQNDKGLVIYFRTGFSCHTVAKPHIYRRKIYTYFLLTAPLSTNCLGGYYSVKIRMGIEAAAGAGIRAGV
jgi:hypothetical protein